MEIIRIYQHKNLQLTPKELYEKLSNFIEDNKESLVDKMSSYTYNNGKGEMIKRGHTKDSHISQSPQTMLLRNLVQNIPCSTFDTEKLANRYIYNVFKSEKIKEKIIKWFFEVDLSKTGEHDINYLELNIRYPKYVGKGIDLGFEELKSREMRLIIRRADGENELGFYIETAFPNLTPTKQESLEKTGREFMDQAIEYKQDMCERGFSRYELISRMLRTQKDMVTERGKTKNDIIVICRDKNNGLNLKMNISNGIKYALYNHTNDKNMEISYNEIKEQYPELSSKIRIVISAIKRADQIMIRQKELDINY